MAVDFPTPDLSGSQSDLSVRIFNMIFGPGWERLYLGEGSTGQGVIFPIMHQVNSLALFCVTVLFVWITAQGVVGTAHEGTPMGKRINTIWTPIRLSFSIASLAPVAGGLSLFQVILLPILGFSIIFANKLTDICLDHLRSTPAALYSAAPYDTVEHAHSIANNALRALVVQNYFIRRGAGSQNPYVFSPAGWQQVQGDAGTVWYANFQAPDGLPLTSEQFGGISVTCSTPVAANPRTGQAYNDHTIETRTAYLLGECAQQRDAAHQLINDLIPIADKLVASSMSATPLSPSDYSGYSNAINQYSDRVTQIAAASTARVSGEMDRGIHDFVEQAKLDGWLTLGSYYWTISQINRRALEATAKVASSTEISSVKAGPLLAYGNRQIIDPWGKLEATMQVASSFDSIVDSARMGAASAGPEGADPGHKAFFDLARFFRDIAPQIARSLVQDDPIVALANAGHRMLDAINLAFGALAGVALFGKIAGAFSAAAAVVTGGAAIPVAAGTAAITGALTTLFILLIPLYIFALGLAYYLPAVPYIVWTVAVVGWIVVVIESMVAAPLWVAAHAMPEGEGLAGERARQGYMLLLGVLCRPFLLVVGMMMAFVIIKPLGLLLSYSFTLFAAGVSGSHSMVVVGWIAMLAILGIVVIIVAHKIFGLCTHLSDKVMNWVGGLSPQFQIGDVEGAAQGAFKNFINQAQGAAAGAGKAARKAFGGGQGAQGKGQGGNSITKAKNEDMLPRDREEPNKRGF